MARIAFVDVSENQGHIDFARMFAAGVRYIIIRAGINGRLDKRLDEYVTGARAAGITVLGLYWFVNPNSVAGPEEQAALAIGACQQYGVRMLMLDLESYAAESPKPPLGGAAYMAWLDRMAAPIRATDLVLTVYTNDGYWRPLFTGVGSSLTDCDVIVATYPHYGQGRSADVVAGYRPDQWEERAFTFAPNGPLTPAGFDGWDAWQFSAGFNQQGPVYGASSGDLDLNFADEAAVARWLDTIKPPDPPHPIRPDENPEESDMDQFRIIYPEGSKYQISNGTRRDVTDAELFFVLGGVFQRPDGTFSDGYGNPIANPDPRKPIAFVADRDKLLALPVYTLPTAPPIVYDEAFAQAVIAASARLLADEAVVPNQPWDGTFHFKRA